jgi:hypothetical protein
MAEIVVNFNFLFDMKDGKEIYAAFLDMLPAALGTPAIAMYKGERPSIAAFWSGQRHTFMTPQGEVPMDGIEFRIWPLKPGFKRSELLAGIIGVGDGKEEAVCVSLGKYGTTPEKLRSHTAAIAEMITAILSPHSRLYLENVIVEKDFN